MVKTSMDTAILGGLSRSQAERRQRILGAATALASKGGYDAVQMRDVAERADVALGTLYRYFPSKVHLLVTIMHEQTQELTQRLDRRPPKGDTAAERVLEVLSRATRALQRDPQLADAIIRALMFADASAAAEVNAVNSIMTEAIITSMRGSNGAHIDETESRAVARVLEQVWWANILAWLSGRSSARQMTDDLAVAARLLLRDS
jgi:TetR/AcrR family transcriptional regulator, cholesterol catabolism regulator